MKYHDPARSLSVATSPCNYCVQLAYQFFATASAGNHSMGSSSSFHNSCFVPVHFRGKSSRIGFPWEFKNIPNFYGFSQTEVESAVIGARCITVMIVVSGAVMYGLVRYWMDHRPTA